MLRKFSAASHVLHPVLGVGLLCACLLLVAYAANHQVSRHPINERSDLVEYRGNYALVPFGAAHAPTRVQYPDPREWRAESDLAAQWEAARWTFWSAIVSAISVLVALVGVVLVQRTLRAAHVANRGFAEAANRQLRAYLTVESVEGTVNPGQPGSGFMLFELRIKIKNCGQTPARRVRRLVEVFGRPGHHFSNDRFGLSGHSRALDIAPNRSFLHAYQVFAQYNKQRLHHPGVQITGFFEYYDFSGAKWRIPFECESRPFASNAANTALAFHEVIQFEEESVIGET